MKNQLALALGLFVLLLVACKPEAPKESAAAVKSADTTAVTPPPAEFADQKYAETMRSMYAAFSKGDVVAYVNYFSENAVYAWNYGDSLAGKAAISEYWTKRRTEIIDSVTFNKQIFLPVKVNKPQSVEAPGIWVLAWYQVVAKYKTTGKKMTQWMHADAHFDANGKIDRLIQYTDRTLIDAALKK